MKRSVLLLSFSLLLTACATPQRISPIQRDERVLFFPTSGYLDQASNEWVVPIHGWIYQQPEESIKQQAVVNQLPAILGVDMSEASPSPTDQRPRCSLGKSLLSNPARSPLYHQRGQLFLARNESERGGKLIDLLQGPDRYPLQEPSQPNGHFRGTIRLDRVELNKQPKYASNTKWVTYQAVMPGTDSRHFSGESQLIKPTGVSVISEIDDTIKVANIPDKRDLLANTFLRPSRAVPGMAKLFQQWAEQGAAFHYLSAAPWQLYPALEGFISHSDFPQGSLHLKSFRTADQSFFDLYSSPQSDKKATIEKLFKTWPGRRFILLGNAGEADAKLFASVARDYPDQIVHIFIRDYQPNAAQERYPAVFQGIPDRLWTIYKDGNDLKEFNALRDASQSVTTK